jgi:hypothetical protein
MFSPLFLDPELGIIDGKHIQAIREGAEDYEYFVMLRQRIADLEARGVHTPTLESAKRLLTDGPLRVTREITLDRLDWKVPKDRALMDQVRVDVLESLESLAELK